MEQIVSGIIAGLIGGLGVFILVKLLPKKVCPDCGEPLPKFRKPRNRKEALWGGWTCQKCGCIIDRNGRKEIGKI